MTYKCACVYGVTTKLGISSAFEKYGRNKKTITELYE